MVRPRGAAGAGAHPGFRLGSLYGEAGLGVNKDVGAAKRSYIAAAEGGKRCKAMHNLAVLFADGGGQGPDYKTASEWFRKAADYGLADSQYNLAVLFARGIGVEQNLIESYKWFSLAAAQGDADAGKKRDDVAKRMDQAGAQRRQARDPDLRSADSAGRRRHRRATGRRLGWRARKDRQIGPEVQALKACFDALSTPHSASVRKRHFPDMADGA